MKVSLIEYTGKGRGPWAAADMLIFAKNTRVKMSPSLLEEISSWSEDKKLSELDYIANTIPASWEFVDYTFMVEEVTRSLTHQLVRTRTASYAQQTMQILDMTGFTYHKGPTLSGDLGRMYDDAMGYVNDTYSHLIKEGVSTEDARDLLPNGIHTNILVKANLRTFIDIFHTRISPRNLGQYRDLAVAMRDEILRAHPWSELFLRRTRDKAMEELDEMIKALPLDDDVAGVKFKLLKLVDQVRRKS